MNNIQRKIVCKCKNIIRRNKSLHSVYLYPPVQGGWEKIDYPIVGKDSELVLFDPYVYKYLGSYVMYVSCRNSGGILRLESVDGMNWDNGIEVLSKRSYNGWENIVNRAYVLKHGDSHYMWYTGQTANTSCIGLATSIDGKLFNRISDTPVIVPDNHFEKASVMNPSVIWDDELKKFRMWYSAGEIYEPDVICYAESTDGIAWVKYEEGPVFSKGDKPYDHYKVGGCDVHYVNGRYIMYYIGYETLDNARICVAKSDDGIHNWIRSSENPIISPSKGGWDSHACYKPSVVYDKDIIRLWYNGRKKRIEKIGIATKKVQFESL